LDYIEDEQDSGRPKPIDIDYLLSNIIPPILSAGGKLYVPKFANGYLRNQQISLSSRDGRLFLPVNMQRCYHFNQQAII